MEERIREILDIPEETQTIEFKRLSGDKIVSKIIQTVVAMANTDGGVVVLGVEDPEKTKLKGVNRIFGIEENKELYDELFHEMRRIIPPIANLKPDLYKTEEGKTIALLKIPKAIDSFRSIDDRVWIRLHKSNKKLTPQEIIKFSYAKGFEKSDKELVAVDFELLETEYYENWRRIRGLGENSLKDNLFQTGLARKDDSGDLRPTRAAALLFARFPTNIMETKCSIRVFKHKGTLEKFEAVPNLIGKPKTIEGPIIKLIKDAHEYILGILESGIEMHSGFVTQYKIPERAIKEAVTNAVIHRDYHLKRDIEVKIFEDRIEILSPGLFPYNITKKNIGIVRSEGYRNDLLVKHLREFPDSPNLDRNEGVRAMRNQMDEYNLFPPIFLTYPYREDSVEVVLLNEERPGEWEKVHTYLRENTYINNKKAREITGIVQMDRMSKLFKKWVKQGLLEVVLSRGKAPRYTKYKLSNNDELRT